MDGAAVLALAALQAEAEARVSKAFYNGCAPEKTYTVLLTCAIS